MANRSVSQTGVGTTASIVIKDKVDFKVSWLVKVSGTVTYTLQHSLDDVNFIDNTDAVGKTADLDGNYFLPVHSVRLNVTAGSGTATLVVRQ